MRLPNETIHQIVNYLRPDDFNAARHTCRTWFLATHGKPLLEKILKRGGWSGSLRTLFHGLSLLPNSAFETSPEWLMSKWISRESALGPDWPGERDGQNSFVEIGHSDFTDMAVSYKDPKIQDAGVIFTVSLCGRFLLVSHGCLIYIYELNHRCKPQNTWSLPLQPRDAAVESLGVLRPVASIICPRRVLECSMDTSSNRFAVAALLDGRMGIVVDILAERINCDPPLFKTDDASSYGNEGGKTSSRRRAELIMLLPNCNCRDNPPSDPPPLEIGPRSIYRNISAEDDPPRSVAICPQRDYVAFGCAAGIELHWVDALTGQDLSRWFPLTAPSDFLYFLPPRHGVDNSKKLRLISSSSATNLLGDCGG
jgi:hypothetical protein